MTAGWFSRFVNFRSVRLRLIALFVLLVTVTLSGFGIYEQLLLTSDLEHRFAARQEAVLVRLATSLSASVWNYDQFQAKRIIDAEVGADDVSSVRVFDAKSRLFVQNVTPDGGDFGNEEITRPADRVFRQILLYADPSLRQGTQTAASQPEIGRIEVIFSRSAIDLTLRTSIVNRLMEILVLDAVLIVALNVSLEMVFRPIRQLRDALFDLAAHHGEDAEELPQVRHSEFGEVVRGFNQTQAKLRQVIARRTQAEEQAREVAARNELAYRELRAAQTSLVQAEKMAGLGSMVAGVAHEINTPLGILMTSASVLNQATLQTRSAMSEAGLRKSDVAAYLETAAESTRLILANAERAAHLIQSFKQVAVDQTSEQRRTFDLRKYLDDLTTSLHPALKSGHAEVAVTCAENIQLDSYPGLLAQVVTNLTMNALAHAFAPEQQGHINVTATCDGTVVTLLFCDDGCGIAPAHMSRIFEPFFTTRRGQGGTGLGLHIVFNIVTKQLAGTIAVRPAQPHGACFELTMPRVTPTRGEPQQTQMQAAKNFLTTSNP